MWVHTRMVVRVVALAVWSFLCFLAVLAGRGLHRMGLARGQRMRQSAYRRWGRGAWRILGLEVDLSGPPPEAPFFLVTNHLSYVDIFVLAGLAGPVFIAKSEIRSWPVVGWFCRSVDTIFIDRTARRDVARVNERIGGLLESGYGVALFAEGTSTSGERVMPFRASLLDFPARAGLRVHYGSLSYRTPEGSPPAHLAICWWGDMTFLDHLLRMLKLSGFRVSVTFGESAVREDDRKQLAAALHQRVVSNFQPVVAQGESTWVARA